MTATSAVNGIVYPVLSDPTSVGQAANFATMNTNVNTSSVPRFANASARDAAITSPIEGQVAYLDTEAILTYRTASAWVAAPTGRTVIKEVSESITPAITTLNADDALYMYAEPNSVYQYELLVTLSGDTASNAMIHQWTAPTGCVVRRGISHMSPGFTNRQATQLTQRILNATDAPTTGYHTAAGVGFLLWERGLIISSTTPGIVNWNWRKASAYATTLTVYAGSYLTFRKIS